jgi:hypothetical protein
MYNIAPNKSSNKVALDAIIADCFLKQDSNELYTLFPRYHAAVRFGKNHILTTHEKRKIHKAYEAIGVRLVKGSHGKILYGLLGKDADVYHSREQYLRCHPKEYCAILASNLNIVIPYLLALGYIEAVNNVNERADRPLDFLFFSHTIMPVGDITCQPTDGIKKTYSFKKKYVSQRESILLRCALKVEHVNGNFHIEGDFCNPKSLSEQWYENPRVEGFDTNIQYAAYLAKRKTAGIIIGESLDARHDRESLANLTDIKGEVQFVSTLYDTKMPGGTLLVRDWLCNLLSYAKAYQMNKCREDDLIQFACKWLDKRVLLSISLYTLNWKGEGFTRSVLGRFMRRCVPIVFQRFVATCIKNKRMLGMRKVPVVDFDYVLDSFEGALSKLMKIILHGETTETPPQDIQQEPTQTLQIDYSFSIKKLLYSFKLKQIDSPPPVVVNFSKSFLS